VTVTLQSTEVFDLLQSPGVFGLGSQSYFSRRRFYCGGGGTCDAGVMLRRSIFSRQSFIMVVAGVLFSVAGVFM
jgi:hypothetical protein